MTINELNQAIMFCEFTNDQNNSIIMSIKFARTRLQKRNKASLRIGDRVRFQGRSGRIVSGTVQKILIKNVTVLTTNGLLYKVSANLLQAA